MERQQARPKMEYLPIEILRPDPFNPRRISDHQMEALTNSIREFDLLDPLIVRKQDNTIIGGHQRLLAAKRLGYKEVPVIRVALSKDQARLLSLALNRVGGEWDPQLLAQLFGELKIGHADLTLSGFAKEEISGFLKSLERQERRHRIEPFDLEKALADAQRVVPCTKPGDLYLLGPHRLLCGDAGSADDLARLVGEEKADLVFTDPPYGVNYVPRERPRARGTSSCRRFGGILNDDEPQDLIEAAWQNIVWASREGTVYYLCAGSSIMPLLHRLFSQTCGREPTIIVWAKEAFSLTRRDYHRQHEFVFYNWLGKKHFWCGGRKEADVWLESREPTSTYCHPTQKPLRLVERALRNSSREGDLVLDPFLGGGTTLIAAERMGRRCYGMELDPYFCDVAIARWESFTGEKAKLADKQRQAGENTSRGGKWL